MCDTECCENHAQKRTGWHGELRMVSETPRLLSGRAGIDGMVFPESLVAPATPWPWRSRDYSRRALPHSGNGERETGRSSRSSRENREPKTGKTIDKEGADKEEAQTGAPGVGVLER